LDAADTTQDGTPARDSAVRLNGPIDLASAPGIERMLTLRVATAEEAVALDLSGTEFIDSSGLSMLVRLRHKAHARGLALVLVDPSPAVRRLLEITRIERLFTLAG
jgi:anti-sigma B factor antagonist